MTNLTRNNYGKFTAKSSEDRAVRSIRATNRVWDDFGFEADKRRITRADLLELIISQGDVIHGPGKDLSEAIALLEKSLILKANAGGAIKQMVREALELLKQSSAGE